MPNASLSWLNLFVSDMQTGFGPFVPVRLAAAGWDPAMIGSALSIGTITAVLAQVPAGILCDAANAKRGIAAAAIMTVMLATLLVAGLPLYPPVMLAEAMQGGANVMLTLSIAGITLSLARADQLGERLGNNVRFSAIGGAAGAALLGIVGTRFSYMAVFVAAAAFGFPALVALARIPDAELAKAPLRTTHVAALPRLRRSNERSKIDLLSDRGLLVLMACVLLFHLANAAMLPLAAGELARQEGMTANLVISGAIIISQMLTAAGSPWAGRLAHRIGRKPILLTGFAMLPLRGIMFAIDSSPLMTLSGQVLDGITGATFGVLLPLIVADLTHKGGRFNLALGMMGLATSVGATVSNYAGGRLAAMLGNPVAFLALSAAGLLATLLVWFALPETKHLADDPPGPATAKPAPR